MHLSHIARMEAERLIRLINDILDVRKIEAGKLELNFEKLSPGEIINSTVQSMKGLAAKSNIELVVEIKTEEAIMCDRDRIVQVLTNLISNAIKFSPTNSQIILRAEKGAPDFVRLSVTDNGPGIAQEHMSKLFLLFQQIDSSDSRPKGGTGLGLAISKAIAEQHGGKIGVDSVVNAGSTFWFEVPCKQLSYSTVIK
jgi:signal transduction histidine kinase